MVIRPMLKSSSYLRLEKPAMNSFATPRVSPGPASRAEAVDRELATAKLADRAIVFQSALEATQHSAPSTQRSLGLPLLLLDLPIATSLEAELIQSLAQRAPRVLATAVRGDTRTIAMLERALDSKSVETEADSPQILAAFGSQI